MFKQSIHSLVLAAPLMLGAGHVAALVVDTGPGLDTSGGILAGGPDNTLGPDFTQLIAGRFNLASATTITSIKGWMANRGPDGGELTASIYSNQGSVPGSRLFSSAFSLGASDTCAGCGPSWTGATGLSWSLAAGSYWVVFEGLPGQTGTASFAGGVDNPLALYRWMAPSLGDYWNSLPAVYSWGVQISDVAAVPAPAAAWLLLSGLGVVGTAARRRRAGRAMGAQSPA